MVSIKSNLKFVGSKLPHQAFAEGILSKYGFARRNFLGRVPLIFRLQGDFENNQSPNWQQFITNVYIQLQGMSEGQSSIFATKNSTLLSFSKVLKNLGGLSRELLSVRTDNSIHSLRYIRNSSRYSTERLNTLKETNKYILQSKSDKVNIGGTESIFKTQQLLGLLFRENSSVLVQKERIRDGLYEKIVLQSGVNSIQRVNTLLLKYWTIGTKENSTFKEMLKVRLNNAWARSYNYIFPYRLNQRELSSWRMMLTTQRMLERNESSTLVLKETESTLKLHDSIESNLWLHLRNLKLHDLIGGNLWLHLRNLKLRDLLESNLRLHLRNLKLHDSIESNLQLHAVESILQSKSIAIRNQITFGMSPNSPLTPLFTKREGKKLLKFGFSSIWETRRRGWEVSSYTRNYLLSHALTVLNKYSLQHQLDKVNIVGTETIFNIQQLLRLLFEENNSVLAQDEKESTIKLHTQRQSTLRLHAIESILQNQNISTYEIKMRRTQLHRGLKPTASITSSPLKRTKGVGTESIFSTQKYLWLLFRENRVLMQEEREKQATLSILRSILQSQRNENDTLLRVGLRMLESQRTSTLEQKEIESTQKLRTLILSTLRLHTFESILQNRNIVNNTLLQVKIQPMRVRSGIGRYIHEYVTHGQAKWFSETSSVTVNNTLKEINTYILQHQLNRVSVIETESIFKIQQILRLLFRENNSILIQKEREKQTTLNILRSILQSQRNKNNTQLQVGIRMPNKGVLLMSSKQINLFKEALKVRLNNTWARSYSYISPYQLSQRELNSRRIMLTTQRMLERQESSTLAQKERESTLKLLTPILSTLRLHILESILQNQNIANNTLLQVKMQSMRARGGIGRYIHEYITRSQTEWFSETTKATINNTLKEINKYILQYQSDRVNIVGTKLIFKTQQLLRLLFKENNSVLVHKEREKQAILSIFKSILQSQKNENNNTSYILSHWLKQKELSSRKIMLTIQRMLERQGTSTLTQKETESTLKLHTLESILQNRNVTNNTLLQVKMQSMRVRGGVGSFNINYFPKALQRRNDAKYVQGSRNVNWVVSQWGQIGRYVHEHIKYSQTEWFSETSRATINKYISSHAIKMRRIQLHRGLKPKASIASSPLKRTKGERIMDLVGFNRLRFKIAVGFNPRSRGSIEFTPNFDYIGRDILRYQLDKVNIVGTELTFKTQQLLFRENNSNLEWKETESTKKLRTLIESTLRLHLFGSILQNQNILSNAIKMRRIQLHRGLKPTASITSSSLKRTKGERIMESVGFNRLRFKIAVGFNPRSRGNIAFTPNFDGIGRDILRHQLDKMSIVGTESIFKTQQLLQLLFRENNSSLEQKEVESTQKLRTLIESTQRLHIFESILQNQNILSHAIKMRRIHLHRGLKPTASITSSPLKRTKGELVMDLVGFNRLRFKIAVGFNPRSRGNIAVTPNFNRVGRDILRHQLNKVYIVGTKSIFKTQQLLFRENNSSLAQKETESTQKLRILIESTQNLHIFESILQRQRYENNTLIRVSEDKYISTTRHTHQLHIQPKMLQQILSEVHRQRGSLYEKIVLQLALSSTQRIKGILFSSLFVKRGVRGELGENISLHQKNIALRFDNKTGQIISIIIPALKSIKTTKQQEITIVDFELVRRILKNGSNEDIRDMQYSSSMIYRISHKSTSTSTNEASSATKTVQTNINERQNISTSTVSTIDITRIAEKVYVEIEKKIKSERQRRGL